MPDTPSDSIYYREPATDAPPPPPADTFDEGPLRRGAMQEALAAFTAGNDEEAPRPDEETPEAEPEGDAPDEDAPEQEAAEGDQAEGDAEPEEAQADEPESPERVAARERAHAEAHRRALERRRRMRAPPEQASRVEPRQQAAASDEISQLRAQLELAKADPVRFFHEHGMSPDDVIDRMASPIKSAQSEPEWARQLRETMAAEQRSRMDYQTRVEAEAHDRAYAEAHARLSERLLDSKRYPSVHILTDDEIAQIADAEANERVSRNETFDLGTIADRIEATAKARIERVQSAIANRGTAAGQVQTDAPTTKPRRTTTNRTASRRAPVSKEPEDLTLEARIARASRILDQPTDD